MPLADLAWLEHFFGTKSTPPIPDAEPSATLQQIHSNLVLQVKLTTGCIGEGDAMVTNQPGIWLSVRTADCFPIILADPVKKAIAVIHSGWKGTAANIVAATIDTMACHYSTTAQNLHASIGPGIGKCCYEVGEDVARHFSLHGKTMLDLASIIKHQLLDKEVDSSNIETSGLCTKCNPELFHSYRRDGLKAGRMISAAKVARP